VDIRHGQRIADNAGEVRDVHDLSEAVVSLETGHQFLAAVDAPRHSHATLTRDFPEEIFEAIERYLFHRVYRFADIAPLDIEDDPRMPPIVGAPDSKVVIGNALDFGVKGVAIEIQFLAADSSPSLAVSKRHDLAVLADEFSKVEKRQQLAEPCVE
jgi:hypothetical protein